MRLSGHLAIGLAQSADAFADVFDAHMVVCITQENPRIGIEKRTRPGLTSTLRAIPRPTGFSAEMPAGSSAQKYPPSGRRTLASGIFTASASTIASRY